MSAGRRRVGPGRRLRLAVRTLDGSRRSLMRRLGGAHRRRWWERLGRPLRRAGAVLARGAGRGLGAIRRPSRRILALAALAAVTAAAAVGYAPLRAWGVRHPYFAVAEIVVAPTAHVRSGALLQWVGLKPGVGIWSVDPGALAARLERHPWIRRASVRREFPRRLVVQVEEREPAAIVLIDQLYYIDRSGVVFARVSPEETLDLPFVTGIEAAVLAGERPFPRHAIRQALKLLQLMRGAGLPFRVSEVHIEREQGITVFPVEPRVAFVFGWNRFPLKLARLGRVLGAFAGRETEIREIDLTYAAQAVIRLRQPGGGGRRVRA